MKDGSDGGPFIQVQNSDWPAKVQRGSSRHVQIVWDTMLVNKSIRPRSLLIAHRSPIFCIEKRKTPWTFLSSPIPPSLSSQPPPLRPTAPHPVPLLEDDLQPPVLQQQLRPTELRQERQRRFQDGLGHLGREAEKGPKGAGNQPNRAKDREASGFFGEEAPIQRTLLGDFLG